jgi:nucleoside-diphosphate-sugar epimerase
VDEWTRVFAGADAVLHLAGRAHVLEESARDSLAAFRAANVEMARRALEGAARAGCRTFVFASSVKAMGERTTIPWTEDTPPHPVDPYGVSKLEAEHVIREGGARLGIRTVSIRFPAIYGPGMRANMLRLFSAVARGVPLPLGSIPNRRSFLYVGNAAAALELAITRIDAGSGLYLVSDGQDVSTPELVHAIARAVGRRPRLVPVPPALFGLAGRIGDHLPPWLSWPVTSNRVERLMGSLQVDTSRIRAELGFVPPYSVDAGMRETAVWFLNLRPQERVL